MELNAKIVLNPDGSYDILLEEKKGSGLFMEVSDAEIKQVSKAYAESSKKKKEILKTEVEAAKKIDKKAKVKAFLKKVIEKKRKAKKSSVQVAKKSSVQEARKSLGRFLDRYEHEIKFNSLKFERPKYDYHTVSGSFNIKKQFAPSIWDEIKPMTEGLEFDNEVDIVIVYPRKEELEVKKSGIVSFKIYATDEDELRRKLADVGRKLY